MRALSITLVASALAFAMTPLVAGDAGDCSGEVIQVGLGDETRFGTVYWVIVGDTPDQAWGYLEYNGVVGLQRGGVDQWPANDPCQTDEEAGPDFMFY